MSNDRGAIARGRRLSFDRFYWLRGFSLRGRNASEVGENRLRFMGKWNRATMHFCLGREGGEGGEGGVNPFTSPPTLSRRFLLPSYSYSTLRSYKEFCSDENKRFATIARYVFIC